MEYKSTIETILGVDFDDPQLPREVKAYVNANKLNQKQLSLSPKDGMKHVQNIQKLIKNEPQASKDFRMYANILTQTPSYQNADETTREAMLDSVRQNVNLKKTDKDLAESYLPSALKKLKEKDKPVVDLSKPSTTRHNLIDKTMLNPIYLKDPMIANTPGDSIYLSTTSMNQLKSKYADKMSDIEYDPIKGILEKKEKEKEKETDYTKETVERPYRIDVANLPDYMKSNILFKDLESGSVYLSKAKIEELKKMYKPKEPNMKLDYNVVNGLFSKTKSETATQYNKRQDEIKIYMSMLERAVKNNDEKKIDRATMELLNLDPMLVKQIDSIKKTSVVEDKEEGFFLKALKSLKDSWFNYVKSQQESVK